MPASSRSANDVRWLIPVALVAALSYGAYCFLAPNSSDFARIARELEREAAEAGRPATETLSGPQQFYQNLSPDEREYIDLAVAIVDRGEFVLPSGDVAKRLPTYPAFLALLYRTQPLETWYSAVALIQTFLAWGNVLFIALIAARVAGKLAGLTAGLIAALYAPFLYLETLFLTETLLNTIVLSAVLLYVSRACETTNDRQRRFALVGVSALMGLATLTRANAVLFLLPFAIDTLARTFGAKARAMALTAVLFPAILVITPWAVRNQQHLGRFTLSTIGGQNFYLGHNPNYSENPGLSHADYGRFDRLRTEHGLSETEADDVLYRDAWSYIRENPGQTLRNITAKAKVWFSPTIASFGPLLIALLALIRAGHFIACRRADPHGANRPDARETRQRTAWGLSQFVEFAVLIAMVATYVAYLLSDSTRKLPLISPAYVLLLGVPALIYLQFRGAAWRLFLGLVAVQFVVAVAIIPLSRLRWTVDAFFIIALAAIVSRTCEYLNERGSVRHSPSRSTDRSSS